MVVRFAQEDDLGLFEPFSLSESLGTGWGPDAFRDALENEHDHLWIVTGDDAELKGFLVARLVAGEAELLNVVVAMDARRMGIGRALMKHWIDKMKEEGAQKLFLEVRVSNKAAITLYRGFGFTDVGKRKAYYQPDLEDALVMARSL